eukprot:53828_1
MNAIRILFILSILPYKAYCEQLSNISCPLYWWMDEGVCDVERCSCIMEDKNCCLLYPNWNVTYDEERHRISSPKCAESYGPQMVNPYETTDWSFQIGISQQPEVYKPYRTTYPCKMNIFWRLEFQHSTYEEYYEKYKMNASVTNIVSAAGMSIDKTNGWLTVWGTDDVENATVRFTVKPLNCDCNGKDYRAQQGKLVIVNATSECQPDCFDGRIYPMKLSIYFYRSHTCKCFKPSNESQEQTESKEQTESRKLIKNILITVVVLIFAVVFIAMCYRAYIQTKRKTTNDFSIFDEEGVESVQIEGETTQ